MFLVRTNFQSLQVRNRNFAGDYAQTTNNLGQRPGPTNSESRSIILPGKITFVQPSTYQFDGAYSYRLLHQFARIPL